MILFLDRCLGTNDVAAALRAAGANVVLHADQFPATESDENWLRKVGAKKWVVLTKDERIRTRYNELWAIIEANTHVFALTLGSASGAEMAAAFVAAWPAITRLVGNKPTPFLASVGRLGKISRIELYSRMQERLETLEPPQPNNNQKNP
jgi:hypothetical protein